jgi:Leucine-rich repeat (LRR) protein
MGMKQILVMMVAVVLVGCSNETPETSQAAEAEAQPTPELSPALDPVPPVEEKVIAIADPIVEKAVRKFLRKPEGELTEPGLEKVTSLDLGLTQITAAGLKDVAKLQKLTYLDLTNTKITDAGLKELAKLQQLKELHLLDTQVTDAGLVEVAKLQNLERLSLGYTKITDAGLKEVAKLQNLEVLYLFGAKVTKAGLAELRKALPNCKISGP